jgi:hypothetical protein
MTHNPAAVAESEEPETEHESPETLAYVSAPPVLPPDVVSVNGTSISPFVLMTVIVY